MKLIMKKLVSIFTLIFIFSGSPIYAQIHEITFVATDHHIDFESEYEMRLISDLLQSSEPNTQIDELVFDDESPQFKAVIAAIGEVYVNFVSSDTARYMKDIRPLIVKNKTGDYYSSLPGIIKEHKYFGTKKHSYETITISVDNFVSFCREMGINCDLANSTFGTEIKHYKFQQRATNLVYENLCEDLASWCTDAQKSGKYLYNYALKVGDVHPYEKEGFSVIPVSVILKQNNDTRQFYDMFINVMNAMRIPDSIAHVMKEKNYKTYHIKMYTLPPFKWQTEYRERALKDYYNQSEKPYFYASNDIKVVDGMYYNPLNTIALNSIFERIHYQFQIYDNISGIDGFSYLITDAMHLVPEEVYEQSHRQFDDDNETYYYMSDLGYTSCAYDMENNGNIVMLAITDTGDFVTESITFDIIINNNDLMKLTYLNVTNAPDMEYERIFTGNEDEYEIMQTTGIPDFYAGWAYYTGSGNTYEDGIRPWNEWNTKYILGFKYGEQRNKITHLPKTEFSKIDAFYILDEPGVDYARVYIKNGEWVAQGGDDYNGYSYKGTISEDGRLIISEGKNIRNIEDEITTEKATKGQEYGRLKYHTIVTQGLILRRE